MSQLSQNLEKIIQMISIEQLLGLVKQNTDNKSNSDIMNLPIVQKVVKAYEDEIQVLQTPASSSSSSCEKDYSVDIAKINEQLASINNNLLQLTEAIRNINISTKEVKREELVVEELKVENVVVEVLSKAESLEEEHVRLKIEEKQEVISKAESELEEEEESSAAEEESSVAEEESSAEEETVEEEVALSVAEEETEEVAEIEEEEEESEKEISDEESIASSNVVEEEEEVISVAEDEEEEEEVFEIEIDDVTYYATSEENGILYEVDADGEVGKKVGIIKDGEPIFI